MEYFIFTRCDRVASGVQELEISFFFLLLLLCFFF
jgi:hypothetical protein